MSVSNKQKQNLDARLPCGRCSQLDLVEIKAKANRAGLSVSAYMRVMALEGSVMERKPLLDAQAITQIRRIGVNLNQYVSTVHSRGREVPERLEVLLTQIEQALERLSDDP